MDRLHPAPIVGGVDASPPNTSFATADMACEGDEPTGRAGDADEDGKEHADDDNDC